MQQNGSRRAAFATGPGLPWLSTSRQPMRRSVCRAAASVEAASAVTVTVENSGDDQKSIIRLVGEDKPYLLRHLTTAVEEAGFAPTRINVADFIGSKEATSEFTLDKSITDADVEALRAKVQSVWADAPGHATVDDSKAAEKTLVSYEVGDCEKIPEDVVERGVFFNVDPFAHADWTTVTAICEVQKGTAQDMMAVFDEEKLNIIFASIRSIDVSDSGVAADIYLLQTLEGEPLGEAERVSLHNRLIKVVVSE